MLWEDANSWDQDFCNKTENDQKIKLSADFDSALATSPLNATWLMMARISINPQLLRLIFIDSTPEINGCFRALALWPQRTVCAAEWRKSRPLVPLPLREFKSWLAGNYEPQQRKRVLKILNAKLKLKWTHLTASPASSLMHQYLLKALT